MIQKIYYRKGRLRKVIESAKLLIERSKSSTEVDENSEEAIPRITAGGIITLSRILDKLDVLCSATSEPETSS